MEFIGYFENEDTGINVTVYKNKKNGLYFYGSPTNTTILFRSKEVDNLEDLYDIFISENS